MSRSDKRIFVFPSNKKEAAATHCTALLFLEHFNPLEKFFWVWVHMNIYEKLESEYSFGITNL